MNEFFTFRLMKNKVSLLFCFVVFFIISACRCTDEYCRGINNLNTIYLHGFSEEEIDSVSIYVYESSSNFTNPIDSFFDFTQKDFNEYYRVYLNDKIDIAKEYKLILNGTGESYAITDFETEEKGCGECGLLGNRDREIYTDLASYKINDQRSTDFLIRVCK